MVVGIEVHLEIFKTSRITSCENPGLINFLPCLLKVC